MCSSVRGPRSAGSIPSAVNSSFIQPHPTPSTKRPSVSTSSAAASAARLSGLRYGRTRTLVPRRTRSVTAAHMASVTSGSSHCMPGDIATSVPECWYGYRLVRSYGRVTWCATHTESKPEPLGRLGHRQHHVLAVIEADVR